jgi:electron transport complex protein RnfE
MKEKNSLMNLIYDGVIKSNPALVLMLGMCPTLAVTTSASNGFGMGVSTMAVLIVSNMLISLLRKIIPDAVRLPAYIVVVASLVTVVEMITQAYLPGLYSSLGLYIPLIVVNCIILGRAEAFASQNKPIPSIFDGIGMGLGFTLALVAIGTFRELLGAGSVFGFQVMPESYQPIAIFVKAPGAFLVIAIIIAVMNAFSLPTRANEVVEDCDGCCAHCNKCPSREKEV